MTASDASASFSRPPAAALRPFVDLLWAADGREPSSPTTREVVLPTGALHFVVRLEDRPLRVFRTREDAAGFTVGAAVIGGARAAPYLKDNSNPCASVGALLRPGAAGLILGAPAGVFTGAHWALEDVWGRAAVERLRQRLAELSSPARRLALLEAALQARLLSIRRIDPRIALALAGLRSNAPVSVVAERCDLSQRHFTRSFREAVGLAPKAWCRVHRFGRALERLAADPALFLADVAAAEGYADQAHFTREFRALAGLSPGAYRRRAPLRPRHVPL